MSDEFELIHEFDARARRELCQLYGQEWWTSERSSEDIAMMLQHSDVVLGFRSAGTLVAFARVLTDRVYKALVLDVIVAEAHRGKGLGQRLMDALHGHEDLRRVRHFELYCLPEMQPFYARWGYDSELGELKFMRALPR